MNLLELFQHVKKLNRKRGGTDWHFDRDHRLDVRQRNGGVECMWFDGVSGQYRRTYVKGAVVSDSPKTQTVVSEH